MKHISSTHLPLKGKVHFYQILSWLIAAAMLISSITSIILRKSVYPTYELTRAFLANDIVNIVIGIPVLVVPICLVRSNKLTGLLLWPGALFFILYNYLIYLFSLPVSIIYVLYLFIIIISFFVLFQLLRNIDVNAIRSSLDATIYKRWISSLLILFSLSFLIRAGMQLGNHLLGKAHLQTTDIALNISDILFSVVWITCGTSLLLRKSLGYITVPGLMYQLSMLFIGLIAVMLIQPVILNEPIAFISVMILVGMSLIVIIPFIMFISKLQQKER